MENGPFIDGLPIKNGDFPYSYVSLPEGNPFPPSSIHQDDRRRGTAACQQLSWILHCPPIRAAVSKIDTWELRPR
jgi:hypothetical protein